MILNQLIDLLNQAEHNLDRISDSELWDKITLLPNAHPEINQILADAQHYTNLLKLRVQQALTEEALDEVVRVEIEAICSGWDDDLDQAA